MASRVNNARVTRGRPFPRGNPGRPKGSRNRRTVLVEQLMEGDLEEVTRAVLQAAKGGDIAAAKLVLDRICPVRKGYPVEIQAPKTLDPTGLDEAFVSVIKAMAAGEVSPAEALEISNVLEARRRTIETVELETRLRTIEERAEAEKFVPTRARAW